MIKRMLAMLLTVALLLSGCDLLSNSRPELAKTLKYSEFTYIRPELQKFDDMTAKCRKALDEDRPLNMIISYINLFYDLYDSFYTNYNLAELHYCHDMTDSYWEAEYNFCMDASAEVEAKLEELYRMLAASSRVEELEGEDYFGADFFDGYTGEAVWNEEYMRLVERESLLQSDYYALCAESADYDPYSEEFYDQYGRRFAQILVDLVVVRQEQAEYFGYDSYADMTYAVTYARDYSAAESEDYLRMIGEALGDIYSDIFFDEIWMYGAEPCDETAVFDYTKNTAQAMGGKVLEAFQEMEQRQLYDISYGENKYDGWFEIYLTDYQVPYVFGAPWREKLDMLSFVHEFGHFVNDYICQESYVGTDVSEIQSQGMEYMSLRYTEDEQLLQYKMADSLSIFVDQSAYALFELQIHRLTGDQLTVDNVIKIYRDICQEFGVAQGSWNEMSFVNVGHFYTSPMFVVSYVVSNDLALQFYEMEQQQPGTGLEKYLSCLESEDYYIMEFAETYGLENPFKASRVEAVETLFEEVFAEQLAA